MYMELNSSESAEKITLSWKSSKQKFTLKPRPLLFLLFVYLPFFFFFVLVFSVCHSYFLLLVSAVRVELYYN